MKNLSVAYLMLAMMVSTAQGGLVTVNGFNNNTMATVSFDDGSGISGHSGSVNTLLTQFNVTYSGSPSTINTFTIDLFHTVSSGQTYAVNARSDLATAFTNGSRISYIFQNYGLQDLTQNPVLAAAVQISLLDLSLNNHIPTFFGLDPGGTYSSGDPNVFSVSLGSNPAANQIAALTDQYLKASIGATNQGSWLDAAAAGNNANRGQSLVLPVPEPSSIIVFSTWLFAAIAFQRSRYGKPGSEMGGFAMNKGSGTPSLQRDSRRTTTPP
jgi:hypothetical protein